MTSSVLKGCSQISINHVLNGQDIYCCFMMLDAPELSCVSSVCQPLSQACSTYVPIHFWLCSWRSGSEGRAIVLNRESVACVAPHQIQEATIRVWKWMMASCRAFVYILVGDGAEGKLCLSPGSVHDVCK